MATKSFVAEQLCDGAVPDAQSLINLTYACLIPMMVHGTFSETSRMLTNNLLLARWEVVVVRLNNV